MPGFLAWIAIDLKGVSPCCRSHPRADEDVYPILNTSLFLPFPAAVDEPRQALLPTVCKKGWSNTLQPF